MNSLLDLFFYSLVGGLFSLAGGLLLLWRPQLTRTLIQPLIAFSAGSFLAAAFLDILPEALEMTTEPHPILTAALAGFLLFFTLERIVMKFFKKAGHHDHSDHTESLPFLIILSDCIHNFMDGVVIALAFAANPALGLPTALAIAAHEIPQEISDFSILIHLGWQRKKIVVVNILQSLLTVPGILVGYFLGQAIEPQLPLLLGATAGIFLYIAGSDLIPELHHQGEHKRFMSILVPMVLGVLLVAALSGLAHGE